MFPIADYIYIYIYTYPCIPLSLNITRSYLHPINHIPNGLGICSILFHLVDWVWVWQYFLVSPMKIFQDLHMFPCETCARWPDSLHPAIHLDQEVWCGRPVATTEGCWENHRKTIGKNGTSSINEGVVRWESPWNKRAIFVIAMFGCWRVNAGFKHEQQNE